MKVGNPIVALPSTYCSKLSADDAVQYTMMRFSPITVRFKIYMNISYKIFFPNLIEAIFFRDYRKSDFRR